jgi:hypothetical protein
MDHQKRKGEKEIDCFVEYKMSGTERAERKRKQFLIKW